MRLEKLLVFGFAHSEGHLHEVAVDFERSKQTNQQYPLPYVLIENSQVV